MKKTLLQSALTTLLATLCSLSFASSTADNIAAAGTASAVNNAMAIASFFILRNMDAHPQIQAGPYGMVTTTHAQKQTVTTIHQTTYEAQNQQDQKEAFMHQ